ncbi:MAG: tetratricopeptide repeat protein [Desulfomonilia bacterium]|jgi:Flp pilus assembly protein TadD|nr:tetratricopeptide repeat protein [Pseudomonadota bacterium]HON38830.1 tetratricopeptide repeat protein [Deltaproteobacteria bacterium]HRS56782.1 tetratricopeptide repeat protein [Desulfomonilia bacterium]HPD21788.1 tetratricopeptide repeat protein [Deltaproteobacteria bacterium]HPX18692.1 tetratricopeptide repeat protein [Deltaproteobacteria bacterium]
MPRIVVLEDPLSASEHNELGVIYERSGKIDLARKEYLKAAEKDASWPVPLFNLGNLAYAQGDPAQAERFYRRCLALDGTDADVMNNLAHVLHEMGRDIDALEFIERALAVERKPEYLSTYEAITGRPAP